MYYMCLANLWNAEN